MTAAKNTPHLVLGGARSGKSTYAENLIEALPSPYVYVATSQVFDSEMEERVRIHQERRSSSWETLESPFELVEALESLQGQKKAVLVDCLTLWLTNLLLAEGKDPEQEAARLCRVLPDIDYPLVLVANEVGGGIVPENALARRFRDLAGFTNQKVAAACPNVTLVVAGLPLSLKRV